MPEQELGWCILELFGHIRLGGYVTEEERFGAKMGRIDLHSHTGAITTQYFGGSSIYRLTPTTEEIAKAIGAKDHAPIQRWELSALPEAQKSAPRMDVNYIPYIPGEDDVHKYDNDEDDDDPDDDEDDQPPF
jgi:hypothetical protein